MAAWPAAWLLSWLTLSTCSRLESAPLRVLLPRDPRLVERGHSEHRYERHQQGERQPAEDRRVVPVEHHRWWLHGRWAEVHEADEDRAAAEDQRPEAWPEKSWKALIRNRTWMLAESPR